MAKSKAVDVSAYTPNQVVVTLALDKVRADEAKNLRRFPPNPKEIQELAASIKERGGLINNIVVRELTQEEKDAANGVEYEVVAGYQRWRAIQMLVEGGTKIDELPFSVSTASTEAEHRALNLDENERRNSLSYIDQAFAIREMIEKDKLTKADIAKRMRKSGAYVGYVEKLLNLRPEIQKKIHEGKITFRVARDLPELTEDEQDARIAQAEAGDSAGAESASKASKKAKKKNNRGRKAKEESTDGKALSGKKAMAAFDGLVKEISEKDKYTKVEGRAMELYTDVSRFINGAFGVKALHNRIMKVL